LAIIDKLPILDELFDEVKISNAVWEEISLNKTTMFHKRIKAYFEKK